jgi:hypothetical protein
MTRFRKKPVEVEAWQFNGEPVLEWPNWLAGRCAGYDRHGNGTRALNIHTLEGIMSVNLGDWVIKGTQGEVYPCKPDIFAEIYEQVSA